VSLNSFNANSWLGLIADQKSFQGLAHENKSYNPSQEIKGQFCPSEFFVPGWKGDGLFTKPALEIKKLQEQLWRDSHTQLKSNCHSINTSLKTKIFQEFNSYIQNKSINLPQIQTLGQFWTQLFDENAEARTELDQFLDVYCFRSATLYLYKIRLIVALLDIHKELVGNFTLVSALANPSSFFNKIFPKGSSRELHSEALQSNPFSWYRPSESIAAQFPDLKKSFSTITLSELMKLTSHRLNRENNKKIDFTDQEYSHALSHVSFGLLVNTLLVFFPIWHSGTGFQYPRRQKLNSHEILNTKFAGDNLLSLSHSHWLAQEHNLSIPWSEILCPEFCGEEFNQGTFTRLSHELQFLTFMTLLAQKQNVQAVDLITRAMREKYAKSADIFSEQGSLFQATEVRSELLFDRIVINNANLPKKNPHHQLTTNIQKYAQSMTPKGYMYVFSNQKLFVPSQKSKVEQILQQLKLEACFSFEELRFRGEIPSYLYIFTKRSAKKERTFLDPFGSVMTVAQPTKESTLSFKWHGQLAQFSKFKSFVDELYSFFNTKHPFSTPIFQKDLGQNMYFEFHQDSIVEGTLLSSQSASDSNQVTHPNFFKNLTKTCSPLEQFFSIEQIDDERSTQKKDIAVDLLGIKHRGDHKYPLILIVDRSQNSEVKLELIAPDMYRAKLEQNGKAFFDYFGLVPKSETININLLRYYFESRIGSQIIQLSLNSEPTKVKAKLKTVLVPHFIARGEQMSPDLNHFINTHSPNSEELLKMHPDQLEKLSFEIVKLAKESGKSFPWTVSGLLCFLNNEIGNALSHANMGAQVRNIDFENPLIYLPLTKIPCHSLYPKNDDVYLEFNVVNQKELWKILDDVKLIHHEKSPSLELYSQGEVIVRLFAEVELLQFLKFILSKAQGSSIADLLSKVKVPKAEDLKLIINKFNQIESHLIKFKQNLEAKLLELLLSQIVP